MKEIPDFAISIILSFLEVKEIGRCICLGRAWVSCAQSGHIASKLKPIRARAQVLSHVLNVSNLFRLTN